MTTSRARRLGGTLFAAALIGALATPASVPAQEGAVFPDADFSGYATGSVLHTDLVTSGTTRLENTDVSFSGSAVNSKGLTAAQTNENARVVNPALPAKKAFARGAGVEVGLQQPPASDGQVLLQGKATADAPPTTISPVKQIAVEQDPVISAGLVAGQASARWNDNTCILGSDLARGVGFVDDTELVDVDTGAGAGPGLEAPVIATNDQDPDRAVITAISRNRLVPQTSEAGAVVGPNFGLMSQVDQTLAPVRLNLPADTNPDNDILIEVGGVWRLTSVATGVAGQAWVHYGPLAAEPQTILVKIQQGTANPTTINLQQLTSNTGLVVPIPNVGEVVIGEDPRAIGGDATTQPTTSADGTTVSAAVDVLRVRLTAIPGLADIRLGHMETKAQVPPGGIQCPIPVTKDADPREVTAPGSFLYKISVQNPFDCVLENVTLDDKIRIKSGNPQFAIDEADPRNDPKPTSVTADKTGATWALGNMPPQSSKSVTLVVQALGGSGVLENTATATGTLACPDGTARGEANVKVPLAGKVVVEIPRFDIGRVLPRTGGPLVAPVAIALLTAAGAMWRLRRRVGIDG